MTASARRTLLVLATALLGACGATPPTTPAGACPATPANFVRTDSIYFPCETLPGGIVPPRVLAYVVDVYACGGADVGQAGARQ